MARFGTPIGGQGHAEHRIVVLVEPKDGDLFYATWRGRSIRRMHDTIRGHYKAKHSGCRVSFGKALTTFHYGAH